MAGCCARAQKATPPQHRREALLVRAASWGSPQGQGSRTKYSRFGVSLGVHRNENAHLMVAVGTRIAPRPPHRSRRALLTHRAPPSGRTSVASGLNPSAVRRTAANRIDVATRLCVRTTAVCQLFPLGEALPSTTSAGSCLPLFDRFISTMASSDFSSTYTLGVWLVAFPSRPGTKLRAWMRPPRFRQRTSPRAQGLRLREVPLMRAICHETMLPSPPQNEIGTSDLDPFRSSILGPWSPL